VPDGAARRPYHEHRPARRAILSAIVLTAPEACEARRRVKASQSENLKTAAKQAEKSGNGPTSLRPAIGKSNSNKNQLKAANTKKYGMKRSLFSELAEKWPGAEGLSFPL
jgi:hypothetical protein